MNYLAHEESNKISCSFVKHIILPILISNLYSRMLGTEPCKSILGHINRPLDVTHSAYTAVNRPQCHSG